MSAAPEPSPPSRILQPIISVKDVSKTYKSGLQALKPINLDISKGEIFALLGPNGAGKTTLINIICGIVTPSSGAIVADGHDIQRDYKLARKKIGLVPQELHTDAFERVIDTVSFSRGLFGFPSNPAYVEKVLRSLSLWDKKDEKIMALSGGMKRRVMIAKALSHEPKILFLDEPTAGVDVELRQDMWEMVRGLREEGVTIILTTHYIEEAEEMADRVGVINKGELIVVEEKKALMRRMGKKQLTLDLPAPLKALPEGLNGYNVELSSDGRQIVYSFDAQSDDTGIPGLLKRLSELHVDFKDLHTEQSSLEDIFVSWCTANEFLRRPSHLSLRNGAMVSHYWPEPVLAGALHVALFHRVRRSDRLAHGRCRRRQLRRLHRARPDDADDPDRERLQRLVWHLHAALGRHDL